jgi:hypothetical protein
MPTKTTKPLNREDWLDQFRQEILPLIKKRTGLGQEDRKILLSCGFPSGGGKLRKNGSFTSGQCHHTHGTDRKHFQIFIHPANVDPLDLGEVITHELLHALLPGGVGHRKPFSQAAKKMGLLPNEDESANGRAGIPTATSLTKELAERIKEITDKLGPYPHERLVAHGKRQETRMKKAQCPSCGYISYSARKWYDEAGAPICPQCTGVQFVTEGFEDAKDPLVATEQTIEYRLKPTSAQIKTAAEQSQKVGYKIKVGYDSRFSIRMIRYGQVGQWWIVDHGTDLLGVSVPRLTPVDSREEAIDLIDSLREGLVTYADLETADNDLDPDEDILAELAEDEEEHPDYDDGDLDPDEEAVRALEQAKREAWAA